MEAMDDDDDDDRACFLLLLLMRKSFSRNTADITPTIDEPAMTAISVDIIWVCQGLLEEKLSVVSDDLSFNPVVLANSRVRIATLCAPLTSLMI